MKYRMTVTNLPVLAVHRTSRCRWIIAVAFTVALVLPIGVQSFPEQGRWNAVINETHPYFGVHKSLFKGSKIFVWIHCDSLDQQMDVKINWELRENPCWDEYWRYLDLLGNDSNQLVLNAYYNYEIERNPTTLALDIQDHLYYSPPQDYHHRCDNTINLVEYSQNCTSGSSSAPQSAQTSSDIPGKVTKRRSSGADRIQPCQSVSSSANVQSKKPVFTVANDGVYLFILLIQPDRQESFHADVRIQIEGEHGYLSATEYPLLLFYGASCILYTMYGIAWLVLSFWQWRDLLRIQFWIGAVIFLGMIEMAVFYAEYYSINSTGTSVTGAVLAAEIISCGKRTLARMLVVIVSIGFGIVKPRLGSTLHRILIVGALYFSLASIEASLRVLHPVSGPSSKALMAGVPLSVLDAGIFYWIFQSLMTTMRTLRLRRNLVKLNLYRHFTNTLIFAVIASVVFMIWSIRYLKTAQCVRDWKEIWIDEAYWHVLFSVILLVIMVLWSPSNNNQRYSFSPLIDNMDDDEEEDLVVNAAFSGNMKLRPKRNGTGNGKPVPRNQSIDDELRWVEENIPAEFAEGDLPALDSEEELISSKFELSKMQ